jgi:AbrB family looped-hinge helix DNA binding protein
MMSRLDSAGRIIVPKPLLEAAGIRAGSTVDISVGINGLHIVPASRSARLVNENGVLVASGSTPIDDETVSVLIDEGRR